MPEPHQEMLDAVDSRALDHAPGNGPAGVAGTQHAHTGMLASIVADLSPAYFAMVMATGIVALAAHLIGIVWLGRVLFGLNIVVYATLWVLNILRLSWFRQRVFADLTDHQRGPGFFTVVAASCILGGESVVQIGHFYAAEALWVLGILLWILLIYTILTAFTVKRDKPDLYDGISGAWLLAVVATQAVAALSAVISHHYEQPYRLVINFIGLSMWLWGGMLYIWMISLIFYRYTFFRLSPGHLTPPYWINMGAMAISVLAGSRLIENVPHAPFLNSLLPFLKGFTIFYWATGTWWIPMLVILALWRHVYSRHPLTYDPLYWGAVFPLGMYSACTFEMSYALHLDFLQPVPYIFFYIALAAWTLTFTGLCRKLISGLREYRQARQLPPASLA
ncbi:MAG: tellurite resistance/C4-dicarboxylate transporter family protein [Bryobacterales bacterium]|nr:tellurite resistance/C4-dicarboxylate transporter family protein [Bryobacterales bacterium]